MNKQASVAALGVLFCATAIALGQSYHPTGHVHHAIEQSVGANPAPLTPAQKAKEDEKWRLDQAALAALDAGQYAEAEADAKQSISIGPDSGLAQEFLAVSLNAQGRTQEALQAYKVIADRGGDFARNLVPYAVLLLKSGQWAQAATIYDKALPYLPFGDMVNANSHFSPDVPQPRELAVALHIAQGLTYIGDAGWGSHSRHEEAMGEFDQALRLAPDSALANYYYGFGWQHLDLKSPTRVANAQRAKTAFQKAAALGGADVKKAAGESLTRFK